MYTFNVFIKEKKTKKKKLLTKIVDLCFIFAKFICEPNLLLTNTMFAPHLLTILSWL